MLNLLLPHLTSACMTQASLDTPRAQPAQKLFSTAKKKFPHKKLSKIKNPAKAVHATIQQAQKGDLVLITGSLYLAGEVRTRWISESAILASHNLFTS